MATAKGKERVVRFSQCRPTDHLAADCRKMAVRLVNPERLGGIAFTGKFRREGSLTTIVGQLKWIEDKHVRLAIRQDTIYVASVRPGK